MFSEMCQQQAIAGIGGHWEYNQPKGQQQWRLVSRWLQAGWWSQWPGLCTVPAGGTVPKP